MNEWILLDYFEYLSYLLKNFMKIHSWYEIVNSSSAKSKLIFAAVYDNHNTNLKKKTEKAIQYYLQPNFYNYKFLYCRNYKIIIGCWVMKIRDSKKFIICMLSREWRNAAEDLRVKCAESVHTRERNSSAAAPWLIARGCCQEQFDSVHSGARKAQSIAAVGAKWCLYVWEAKKARPLESTGVRARIKVH